MRIIDDRQTVMFSYEDGICNMVGLNVEWEDSTANGGIGWRGGAIPGVNKVEIAACEICDIAARELRPADLSDGCDLRICMSDRSAETTPVSGDLRKNSGGIAVKSEDAALQILGEHSLRGCQQALAALASGEQFNSVEDFCLGDRSGKEFCRRLVRNPGYDPGRRLGPDEL
jgi:hypothetical protein